MDSIPSVDPVFESSSPRSVEPARAGESLTASSGQKTPPVPAPSAEPKIDREALDQALQQLDEVLRDSSELRFRVAEGDLMVQVVDVTTDEVIRSIPSEKVLELRDHFHELTGLLLDDRA